MTLSVTFGENRLDRPRAEGSRAVAFPRLARQSGHDLFQDDLQGPVKVPRQSRAQQCIHVSTKVDPSRFLVKVGLEERPGHGVAAFGHVAVEARDERPCVHDTLVDGELQVEEVPALPSLIKRAELGSEELVDSEARDVGLAAKPLVVDLKRDAHEPELGEVLA